MQSTKEGYNLAAMIDTLIEEGIEFSVCVARVYMKKTVTANNYSALDYFMISPIKNRNKLNKLKENDFTYSFGRSHRKDVLIKNMSAANIKEFKEKQHLFKKVLHGEHGRVYELK